MWLTSLEVAEMVEKLHKNIVRDIRSYVKELAELKIEPGVFFRDSAYMDANNQKRPCYEISKKGCEFIAHKLTGKKGTGFTAKYINRFHDMDEALRNQANPVLPGTYIEALEQLLITAKENERLVKANEDLSSDLDRYQRYLCENTQQLKKSELAVKLDTSPQRLASKLKQLGIYTEKTSKVSQAFLEKYPDVKIIMEREVKYNVGDEERTKIEWQWTHEGAKLVVDAMIEAGMVTYTENEGFKLV